MAYKEWDTILPLLNVWKYKFIYIVSVQPLWMCTTVHACVEYIMLIALAILLHGVYFLLALLPVLYLLQSHVIVYKKCFLAFPGYI